MPKLSVLAQPMFLWVLFCGGCTLANLTPQARFAESTNTLNDSTRWGRVDAALTQVSPKYVDKWVWWMEMSFLAADTNLGDKLLLDPDEGIGIISLLVSASTR